MTVPTRDPIVANPRPAATVVVLRDGPAGPEVFMVRRHEGTAFMGGAHVFPGGRVEDSDGDADESWCDGIAHAVRQLDGLPPARGGRVSRRGRARAVRRSRRPARQAHGRPITCRSRTLPIRNGSSRSAFRVHDGATTLRAVIEREGLRLALDALVLFSHWVTPPIDSRQFDTRFFMARVPPHQTPAHDDTETTHSLWARPADAIAQAKKQEIVLPPPTWSTLRELEPFESVKEALAWARRRTVVRRMPKAIEQDGHRMLLLPGDPLHPDPAGDDPPVETRFVLIDRRWRAERPPT